MRLGIRDAIGTVLLGAVVVAYLGFRAFGGVPFIQDPRGMAATGLAVGLVAMFAGGWLRLRLDRPMSTGMVLLAVIVFSLGLIAFVSESADVLLAIFIAAVAGFWLLATLFHAGVIEAGPTAV